MRHGRRAFLKGTVAGLATWVLRPRLGMAAPASPTDLAYLSSWATLRRRAAWTDMAPRQHRLREAQGFRRVTVHHCGASTIRATDENEIAYLIEGISTGHLQRGFGDIGYHFMVDYAGRVWEGRSLAFEGAHVVYENPGNIGVVLLGNFERQEPSGAQLQTMRRLVGSLADHFDMNPRDVYGHRDLGASSCPGRYLYPAVAALRAAPGATQPRMEKTV